MPSFDLTACASIWRRTTDRALPLLWPPRRMPLTAGRSSDPFSTARGVNTHRFQTLPVGELVRAVGRGSQVRFASCSIPDRQSFARRIRRSRTAYPRCREKAGQRGMPTYRYRATDVSINSHSRNYREPSSCIGPNADPTAVRWR